MSNKKSPQAFPGRTGMGYENGLSKLEWVATQIYSGNFAVSETFHRLSIEDAIIEAKELLKLCAEQDSN